jgi:hypothetical protein
MSAKHQQRTSRPDLYSRRDVLRRVSNGFGMLAFASLLADDSLAEIRDARSSGQHPLGPAAPHFRPRARSVILLYMDGGVSHIDSFDPKPRLAREHGQPFKMQIVATQFDNNGNTLASPWRFRRYGEVGMPVSELFPYTARHADDLCLIRSMRAEFPEHAQACYFVHTGHAIAGRPSLGAWASYALGTEAAELPGFVVLNGGVIPLGGLPNYSNGFLPAVHQGSHLYITQPGEVMQNIHRQESTAELQRRKMDLISSGDHEFLNRVGADHDAIESAIRNYELAFSMERAVPEVSDLTAESAVTQRLYGLDSDNPFTARYGRQCLLARRLVERGVRFVEVTCVSGLRERSPWDQHDDLRGGHARNALAVDQPIAGLLADLKNRGMLQDTLVVWAGEFGRTPFAQGTDGRDHNPQGFSVWMAGGGVRGGMIYGATDEYGYHAIENVLSMHDLHATILYLLGLDHERLTYRYAGRDFRLTDVHGRVVHDVVT